MNRATSNAGAISGNTMTNDTANAPLDTRFGGANANRSHRGGRAVRVTCPHCNAPAIARSSERVTPLVREFRYQCTNVEGDDFCGTSFVAVMEICRTIVQSARPNPRIKLPISKPRNLHPAALPAPQT